MDDLIRRHAAIKVIDAVFPVDPMKSEYAQGIACGAALAKTYVEQLPSAQQWIPCSERFPEEDGDYLVCYEEEYRKDYGFPKIGIAPYEVDSEHFGVWTEEFDLVSMGSLGSEFVEIDVDAWMPLPEPYKGENDG